ncbi:hypothetical protein GT037_003037 [Alternaria burnsii]|uniref:Uncharacterized protein n=1 Tax=Alternaria burnsii TaxID=1187904 RepID=A0A8H7BCK3_9PLEO|nr:uncharacterized protein GT037_003037 [Alternaria burnsii]KAF7679289.1 hypothetical protein GT037_003037 [Alternaria burnsii]
MAMHPRHSGSAFSPVDNASLVLERSLYYVGFSAGGEYLSPKLSITQAERRRRSVIE